jgi:hypothetical protein
MEEHHQWDVIGLRHRAVDPHLQPATTAWNHPFLDRGHRQRRGQQRHALRLVDLAQFGQGQAGRQIARAADGFEGLGVQGHGC